MPQDIITTVKSYLEPWLIFLAQDPMLRLVQLIILVVGSVVIFLVFYATRDIILRTNSFLLMFFCILLVALLPGVGFLLYLLVRPPRTLKERELERMLKEITTKKRSPAKKRIKKESSTS